MRARTVSSLTRRTLLSVLVAFGTSACLFMSEPAPGQDPLDVEDASNPMPDMGGGETDAANEPDVADEPDAPGAPDIGPDTDEPDPRDFLDLPEELANYSAIMLPSYYTSMGPAGSVIQHDNTPRDNPTTDAGATLGRVLFYDRALSSNGTIACASCHRQDLGFNDDRVFSVGFDGGLTGRHSMTLTNARFYESGRFFWDERADTLEDQVLMPFQDEVEMGLTLEQLEGIVASKDYYAPLFEDAFGDDAIDSGRIARALAQFVRSMVSVDSRYDEGRARVNNPGEDFPNFTAQENAGKRLFLGDGPPTPGGVFPCAGCHATDAFIGVTPGPNNAQSGATNNGLDATTTDRGVGGVTNDPSDDGLFKVGSLRNIELGAPYMHDGRFATLRQVIDHYSDGIQDHPNLEPPLAAGPNGQPLRYDFTEEEKRARGVLEYADRRHTHRRRALERSVPPRRVSTPRALVEVERVPGGALLDTRPLIPRAAPSRARCGP